MHIVLKTIMFVVLFGVRSYDQHSVSESCLKQIDNGKNLIYRSLVSSIDQIATSKHVILQQGERIVEQCMGPNEKQKLSRQLSNECIASLQKAVEIGKNIMQYKDSIWYYKYLIQISTHYLTVRSMCPMLPEVSISSSIDFSQCYSQAKRLSHHRSMCPMLPEVSISSSIDFSQCYSQAKRLSHHWQNTSHSASSVSISEVWRNVELMMSKLPNLLRVCGQSQMQSFVNDRVQHCLKPILQIFQEEKQKGSEQFKNRIAGSIDYLKRNCPLLK